MVSPETLTATYSAVCENGTAWDNTGYIASGNWHGNFYISGIDFNTAAIPDTSIITKVELKIYIDDEYGGSIKNDVANMTKKAHTYHVTDNDKSGFWSDADGSQYLYNSAGFQGEGWHTVELLAVAKTDLQNQLGADWFSVGWSTTTNENNNGRDGRGYSEGNPPQLIVTYTEVSGYGNDVYTAPSANISKVFAVPTSNISKVYNV